MLRTYIMYYDTSPGEAKWLSVFLRAIILQDCLVVGKYPLAVFCLVVGKYPLAVFFFHHFFYSVPL